MALNQPTLQVRRIKGVLVGLVLLLPLLGSMYGFARLGNNAPVWPLGLSDAPPRGSILASDGSVLAAGPVSNRRYPGALAAQIVGFSGKLQPDGRYGLEGLEYTYDTQLQAGGDLVTTIDPLYQSIVQSHLASAAELHNAESGTVVMLEVGSNNILAAASWPAYDPNDINSANPEQFINRAFLNQYEPGSVMKPFVVAALLESNRLTPQELIEAEQHRRVGSQTFSETVWHDPELNAYDILRFSSNTAMTHLAERFSPEELHVWLSHFGFGRDLGMSSVYTRSGGMNHWTNWVPQDQATLVLGQGVSTTSLQLAALYSVFANDGILLSPRLLADEAVTEPRRVLSSATARQVRDMLQYTVETSGLRNSMIPGMTMAGKTGTADIYDVAQGRYIKGDYTLTFAGMFPADNPEVVMVVSLMKPETGATATYMAAPLFQAIGTEIVANWDHTPPRNPVAHLQ